MSTQHSRLYVGLIALLFACVALKKTLLQLLIKCFAGLQDMILDDDANKESTAYSRDIYKELVIQSLDDLLEKSGIEKNEFTEAVGNSASDNDYNINEYRYEEEAQFNSEKIKEYHTRRISQISRVIDEHLLVLHGPEEIKRFKSFKADIKLKYLLNMQNLVVQSKHEGADKRLRMKGITQSYNVYDSVAFKNVKTVQQKLLDSNNKYSLLEEDEGYEHPPADLTHKGGQMMSVENQAEEQQPEEEVPQLE